MCCSEHVSQGQRYSEANEGKLQGPSLSRAPCMALGAALNKY